MTPKQFDLQELYDLGYCNRLAAATILGVTEGGKLPLQMHGEGCRVIKIPRGDNGRHTWLFKKEDVEKIAAERAAKKAKREPVKFTPDFPKSDVDDLFSVEGRLNKLAADVAAIAAKVGV